MRKKSRLLVRPQSALLLRFCVQELRQDTRDAAFCMFTDEAGKRFFRIVTLKEFGDFNRLSRFVQCRSLWSNLQPSHHIASDDGQESNRTRAYVRPELLLQNLEEIPLWEIHPED